MFLPLNGIISTLEVSSSAAAKGESISTTPEVLSIVPGQLTIRLYWPALQENGALGVKTNAGQRDKALASGPAHPLPETTTTAPPSTSLV